MVTEKRLRKIKNVVAHRQSGFVVVLEDIHDPHNAEAIFRSCDAFGVQEVYLIFDKEKPYNPQKIGKQSSSSANKWLTFHIFHSAEECLSELKKMKYKIVATALGGESLFDAKLEGKIALLVGNEHSGLSEEALTFADLKLMIPMRGMVESLNVSVASALFLFEATKQRADKGLTKSDQIRLVEDFSARSSKRMNRSD
ncbi:MAG: RNA methyltransferase [Nanoarchaeota archaeon]